MNPGKKLRLLFVVVGLPFAVYAQLPNTWTQKADVGYNNPNGPGIRDRCIAFSINGKGYIGGGSDPYANVKKNDFWEFDTTTNVWTQKANIGGGGRSAAIGFSIGSKGYAGLGSMASGNPNDIWEYDPVANIWTQKSNFPGGSRTEAAVFTIGNRAYIGTGYSYFNNYRRDFWEYFPEKDSWRQVDSFGGAGRVGASTFTIISKGYVGMGESPNTLYKDLWEFSPSTGTWTKKADLPGLARRGSMGFCVDTNGYIVGGYHGFPSKEVWKYSPATNSWSQKANYTGGLRVNGTVFMIGCRPIVGMGTDGLTWVNDIWEYFAATDTWKQRTNLGGDERQWGFSFSIGNKGYMGAGSNTWRNLKDFWEYDPETNTWTQKADFGGVERTAAVGFAIGNKGYAGTGMQSFAEQKDFWEYDPALNTWTQKADFGGGFRQQAAGFSIGNKGYVGTGTYFATDYKDFWEYNPASNTWSQKTSFGGAARKMAVGFSVKDKGYIGTGTGLSSYSDFWEYDPATNVWVTRSSFVNARRNASAFSIGNKGYMGLGYDAFGGYYAKDLWEYDPATDVWTKKTDFGGSARMAAGAFSIGNKGYIGCGKDINGNTKDMWEYTSNYNILVTSLPTSAICAGATLSIPYTVTGTYYAGNIFTAWLSDENGSFANAVSIGSVATTSGGTITATLPSSLVSSGKYKIRIASSSPLITGNTFTSNIQVSGTTPGIVIVANTGNKICMGATVTFTASSSGITSAASYQWKKNSVIVGTGNIYTDNAIAGNDTIVCLVSGTNPCGSNQAVSDKIVMQVLSIPALAISGDTAFCSGDTAMLIASPAAWYNYQWLRNDTGYTGNNSDIYAAIDSGTYKAIVTDIYQCSDTTNGLVVKRNALPSVSIVTADTAFCDKDSLMLTAVTNIGILSYAWLDTSTISNAAAGSLYIQNGGIYRVFVVDSNGCSDTSSQISIVKNPLPQPVITRSFDTLFTGSYATYQWYYNAQPILGATGRSLVFNLDGNYSVEVTDSNSCSNMSILFHATDVSSTVNCEEMGVYPNPVSAKLFIRAPYAVDIVLADLSGQIIKRVGSSKELDMSDIPNGVYILQIQNLQRNAISRTRVVKQE